MKKNNTIRFLLFICFFCSIGIPVLDIYNLPTRFFPIIMNMNYELQSILWSSMTTAFLFCLAYILIDRYNLKKINNQKDCAQTFLESVYDQCLDNIQQMDNRDIRKLVLRTVNPDERLNETHPFMRFKNEPFQNENVLFEFLNDGNLDVAAYRNYLRAKKYYSEYMTMLTILYEGDAMLEALKLRAVRELNNVREPLKREHVNQVLNQ